jgi:hypothetical protein
MHHLEKMCLKEVLEISLASGFHNLKVAELGIVQLVFYGIAITRYELSYPDAPWCWNIYQHLPEQNHPVM